ncbi:MAG: cupin domain-containing protein [Candidatus Woesearchaeota archaeon]
MKITKEQATREDWDEVKSWNYKLKGLNEKYQSVVYAELKGPHSEVTSNDVERIYYIIEGNGEFIIEGQTTQVQAGDVITIPPNKTFDYTPTENETLKVVLFMELWDN